MFRKSYNGPQEHIEPQAGDLTLIRALSLRDVKEAEIWTGRMHLADDQIDRAHERFSLAYLQRFAQTLPGKSLMGGHDYTTLPLGRFYKASVQKNDRGHYLDAYYYVAADSPLVPQIELGVLSGSSIGYNAGRRVCDLCEKAWSPYGEKDGCEHWPGADFDGKTCTLTYCPTEAHKAEAMEGSFVWAPCQPAAQAIPKSFDAREVAFLKDLIAHSVGTRRLHGAPNGREGDAKMPTLEEVQAELVQTKDAHEKAQRELQALKAQAADGEWGRTFLKTEIARLAGLLEMSDTYAVVLANLEDAPCEKLVPIYEELGKKVDAKFSKGQAHAGLGDPPPPPQDTQRKQPGEAWRRRRLFAR